MFGDVVLFHTSAAHRQGEIGYVFHPAVAGQGYGREATAAVMDLAFDKQRGLGLHRVAARIDTRNAASIRLAQRLGMREEGRFREIVCDHGEWADLVVFAVISPDWRGSRGARSG